MVLLIQLLFVIVRPMFAVFLVLGAIIGVAASVVIMNLLVGYFSVASDAYISVHPHVLIHGSWSAEEGRALANRLPGIDRQITMAAPALHFNRTITLASVNVITELCDKITPEENCTGKRNIGRSIRAYAYDVIDQKQVEVQVRGISVINNDTVANYRRLMAAAPDLGRLQQDRDSGGNELPTAFIAQDTLINKIAGSYLLSPAALAPTYTRYFRLQGIIRLGAKSSGAPLLILGLEQALALAPPNLKEPNVIEVRLATPLLADHVVAKLREVLGSGVQFETWIDKERSAFEFLNATWVMVFAVMLSICLVVAISIYSTLTLSILRNSWKVALLGSIGYSPLRIMMVFMTFAVGVAFLGIAGGVLLGQFLSYRIGGALYQSILGLSAERFAATVTWRPAAWMAAATVAIFVVAAIMPARRAVMIRPAQALRGLA
jgi:ABC-type lipoprotein release transport system permease subunit